MAQQTMAHPATGYPEGEAQHQQVARRQRNGLIWSNLFLAATLVAILALLALLYNIIDGAYGFVALQNSVDPDAIVMEVERADLLALPNLQTSEDDNELAAGVAGDSNSIGFFGYAYYQEHAASLNVLQVDGVAPSVESIHSGEYPLARPLFLYTTASTLAEKPEVAAFATYYLNNVNEVIDEVGYFVAPVEELEAAKATLQAAAPNAIATSDGASREIRIAGSSTVFPLSQRLADGFTNSGHQGEITIDNIGTRAGIIEFCEGRADIASASRPMTRQEIEACRKAKREPIGLLIGTDALAIVASRQNNFLQSVTTDQLRAIFGETQRWSEVDSAWPDAPIMRFAPGGDSGTLDYFVEAVIARDLSELDKEDLVQVLEANVSRGLMRRFENDQPLAERSQQNVYELVLERVVEPKVVDSWSLTESVFKRADIEATIATIPNGELEWRSWVSPRFLASAQDSSPDKAGIRPAILGSLWVIFFTLLIALPVGVGAAVYLEEYAQDNWLNRLIETNINNLAGVPSIIYGMLGLAIFVRVMEPVTSGKLFGLVDATTANGRTVISASLTLALLVLPLIIINAREAIRAVPDSLRQAGFGLGATRWQVVWAHVLPSALPGILTGNILAMSRAIGETAPLVVVGASTFIALDPNGPFAKFTTLPAQIYQWTSRPQAEFHHIAAAAILVLLVLLLSLNATAIVLRNRFAKQL
jgi:phosphate transport system permease protein